MGGDLMPETIPHVGLLIVRSDPGLGKFDFDQQKPGIKSEGFLRVTDPTCSDMLSRCYKAFYVSLIL